MTAPDADLSNTVPAQEAVEYPTQAKRHSSKRKTELSEALPPAAAQPTEPAEQSIDIAVAPNKTVETLPAPSSIRRRRKKSIPEEEPAIEEAQPLVEALPAPHVSAETIIETPLPTAPKTRKRKKKTKPVQEAPSESAPQLIPASATETAAEPPQKTRKRRKKETAQATPVAVEQPTVEKPVVRHPSVRVHFHHGIPSITVGEQIYRPFFFFGNPHSTDAGARVHQELQFAFEAGVELVALLIPLPARDTGAIEAFDQIRYWTALVREMNPKVQILWRIVPAAVGDWAKQYPEAVIRYADGTLGGPSVCAERWWAIVQEQLAQLVSLVEREDEGAHTLGYHLDWGEWFYPESGGHDTSESALEAFREWLRRHYKGDTVSLRACWFDGNVSFSTATIPAFQPSAPPQKLQFAHLRREGRCIDYRRFLSEITAKRILTLAEAVKQASQSRVLVGASYGYLLEWRHPYSGHLAIESLLRSDSIDFLSAPITYSDRLPKGTGTFPTPVDSVHLHRKLFISEEDYRTPFGWGNVLGDPATERTLTTSEPDDYNPPLRSVEEVVQAQARSVGQALTFGFGSQWMDLWGEGWLANPVVWENARTQQTLWDWRERTPQTLPDLAVIVDPGSMRYVRDGSRLLEQVVIKVRESLMRSGISVGFYLLEDIVRREFPLTRMVLFLNAWRMSRSVRKAIERKLQRNQRTLVWLYAGSLFKGHRDALATAREVVGLALARQPWASTQGTQIVNPTHPIARALGTDKIGAPEPWEPSFYVLDEDAEVIGQYIDTGLPSLVVKDFGDWRSVFIGERTLTSELIRAIAQWAGVHVWLDTNDVVHMRRPWLHIHASQSGRKRVLLPEGWSVYDPAERQTIINNDREYSLVLQEGESRILLVDNSERLSALLQGESLPPLDYEEPLPEPDMVSPESLIPIVTVEPIVISDESPATTPTTPRTSRKRQRKGTVESVSSPLQGIHWRKSTVETNGGTA